MNAKLRWLLSFLLCAVAVFLCAGAGAGQAEQAPPKTSPVIKSSVNEVLVPVVARNGHGEMVENLKKEDFTIFDNGKPVAITGFAIEKRGEPMAVGSDSNSLPNPSGVPASVKATGAAQRWIVLLFDDLNLNISDLIQAQKAAGKLLEAPLAGKEFMAVVSTSGSNSGFTQDRAELRKAVLGLRSSNLYRHSNSDCPNVDYYQGDLIVNKNDSMALQAAAQDALACAKLPSMELAMDVAKHAAQQAVALGDQDVQATLGFLKVVVAKMGKAPGRRLIILVSPGFQTTAPEHAVLTSEVLDIAAQSDVTISALNARGVYTTTLDASERGTGSPAADRMKEQYRRASMSSDETVMSGLAAGTGGTYVHGSNDLEGLLGGLVAGPKYLYLLTFSISDVKADGLYHKLKVQVNQDGVKLQARPGYAAPKPGQAKK